MPQDVDRGRYEAGRVSAAVETSCHEDVGTEGNTCWQREVGRRRSGHFRVGGRDLHPDRRRLVLHHQVFRSLHLIGHDAAKADEAGRCKGSLVEPLERGDGLWLGRRRGR